MIDLRFVLDDVQRVSNVRNSVPELGSREFKKCKLFEEEGAL